LNALAISLLAALLMLAGAGAGILLRRRLPHQHLNEHSKDVVRLGASLVATITALLLGLLITSAKTTYETQRSEVRQIASKIVLLDNQLKRYGPEAAAAREAQRRAIPPLFWSGARPRRRRSRSNGGPWGSTARFRRSMPRGWPASPGATGARASPAGARCGQCWARPGRPPRD